MFLRQRALGSLAAPLRASRAASIRTYASPAVTVTSTRSNATAPLLGNIEASWKDLSAEEQYEIHQQLRELQKKDWKELTVDEKKAAYWVAFGPHGPRAPIHGPNHGFQVFAITAGVIGASVATFMFFRSTTPPPPHTMTKEYQEQMTEYMRSQKMNPISGVSSEGYQGKGMVQ
ncbi:cytochrome c oxidase subunit V [Papiliotrema laurentii]|uniref:Cytochrome c oxidase subunit V n=1 Tax=Papiliotrema laurentii TaxID=5418 RepID=A0AAD9FUW0_PAPLA|nr:cytochrome c oxidase subunit V [Papiliotrema laurentii]